MPINIFFATRHDLEPALHVAEALRPLQYVLCNGYPECDTPTPPVFYAAQDIPMPDFAWALFLIMDRETELIIHPTKKRSEEDKQKYKITVGGDRVCFVPRKRPQSVFYGQQ